MCTSQSGFWNANVRTHNFHERKQLQYYTIVIHIYYRLVVKRVKAVYMSPYTLSRICITNSILYIIKLFSKTCYHHNQELSATRKLYYAYLGKTNKHKKDIQMCPSSQLYIHCLVMFYNGNNKTEMDMYTVDMDISFTLYSTRLEWSHYTPRMISLHA